MFLLYNLFLTLLAPVWAPWMLWRAGRRGERPNWRERMGDYRIPPGAGKRRVWLHAVSVGEVMAALPVLRELRSLDGHVEVLLSVTTSSGYQTARERAKGLYEHLAYFPMDVARFQVRAMERVRPAVVAIMETELWMNFLWAAKAFGAKTLLVNGRISDRSFPRARRLRPYYSALLGFLDRCLMQTERDAARIQELGARQAEVLGNTKFDEALEMMEANPQDWRGELGLPPAKPVVVVGSTRGEAEESLVLEAIEQVGLGRMCVVHAPRHLERAPALEEAVRVRFGSAGLRSKRQGGDYVILDSYGELSSVYALADVAIVGGGFQDLGGQNLIQPLAHGKPVLHGPHMQNFADVAAAALESGASRVCRDTRELAGALRELLDDPHLRASMGSAARSLAEANRGASKRCAQAIADALEARDARGC